MTAPAPSPAPEFGLLREVRLSAQPTDRSAGALRSGHGHIWQLADGTGLHVPYGVLASNPDESRLFCHLCGRGFLHLGAHIRVHGYSAADYRADMGLRATVPLSAPRLSRRISARQKQAFDRDAAMRQRLAAGHELARTGELTRLARGGPQSEQRSRERREHLTRGRTSRRRDRDEQLSALVLDAGEVDLKTYLRGRYLKNTSLEQLARESGLGRTRVRALLVEAGADLRSPGSTTAEGRRSRARRADVQAAASVGTDDIAAWVVDRRNEGWSFTRIAAHVGRSTGWVRARLERAV